jgi:hypothetical protein
MWILVCNIHLPTINHFSATGLIDSFIEQKWFITAAVLLLGNSVMHKAIA